MPSHLFATIPVPIVQDFANEYNIRQKENLVSASFRSPGIVQDKNSHSYFVAVLFFRVIKAAPESRVAVKIAQLMFDASKVFNVSVSVLTIKQASRVSMSVFFPYLFELTLYRLCVGSIHSSGPSKLLLIRIGALLGAALVLRSARLE